MQEQESRSGLADNSGEYQSYVGHVYSTWLMYACMVVNYYLLPREEKGYRQKGKKKKKKHFICICLEIFSGVGYSTPYMICPVYAGMYTLGPGQGTVRGKKDGNLKILSM